MSDVGREHSQILELRQRDGRYRNLEDGHGHPNKPNALDCLQQRAKKREGDLAKRLMGDDSGAEQYR